ncbi:DUF4935 domain-containing protein [Mameliella alba]|nr:DUF4935 domain-containing protein [Antarctobacter heliothermus]MBY6143305.1 DUF4935 domain-containing protein [Mameliella alba]MCA0952971.1 PIN domain-containing protein [Mameliella alba]
MTSWLVFVDTNILLDFYRLRGASALKYLSNLEKNKSNLILTEQVHMEYLKHRQRVVSESIKELVKPAEQKLPAFVSEYQAAISMRKNVFDASEQHKKLKEKITKVLDTPRNHDEVFKAVNRIFNGDSKYYLGREHDRKNKIRSLARKRFSMGYPPRKSNDVSIGDAINWEWIVECAKNCEQKSNVMIVSRDGDFGIENNKKFILNDWLQKEFKERVSQKRKVELTNLLSSALKKIAVQTPKEDIEAEKEVAETTSQRLERAYYSTSGVDPARWKTFSDRLTAIQSGLNLDSDALERIHQINKALQSLAKGIADSEGD